MTAGRRILRVDVVSDVVCPWCFVGKRRLERAAGRVPEATLDVHYRPFQLDPTIPAAGVARQDYLLRKFQDPERIATMHERLATVGAGEGIPFHFERIAVSPNTLDAHRTLRWAEAAGVQPALKERLMEAYFVEGANLADRAVLAGLAADAGLSRDDVGRRLDTDEDVAAVEADVEAARRMGVTGVPFFIFDGRLALSGAHESDTIARAIRQALAPVPGT